MTPSLTSNFLMAFFLLSVASLAPLEAQERAYDPPAKPRVRFVDHGDYIEDLSTGLLWQKDGDAAGKHNFYQAAEYAKTLRLGGLDGWRVPTRQEIASIFPATEAPFTNTGYQPEPYSEGAKGYRSYWTSDLDSRLPDYAYVFQWYHKGGANNGTASSNYVNVRCVRNKDGVTPTGALQTSQSFDVVADLLRQVGDNDRDISDRAMLAIRKMGPAALPAVQLEYERQKRRLMELEILLGDQQPRR